MSIAYTWVINALEAYPQYEGESDVVFTVHWTFNGSDGTHDGSVYGSVGVSYQPGEAFTPFNNLTEAQVIGWVTSALGTEQVDALKSNIDKQIADKINPPSVTLSVPW